MQLLKKKVCRLSVCSCGFPALKNKIDLGHEYKIPRYNAIGVNATWICGGCKQEKQIPIIMVLTDDKKIQWLPMELFDWDEKPETITENIREAGEGIAPLGEAG